MKPRAMVLCLTFPTAVHATASFDALNRQARGQGRARVRGTVPALGLHVRGCPGLHGHRRLVLHLRTILCRQSAERAAVPKGAAAHGRGFRVGFAGVRAILHAGDTSETDGCRHGASVPAAPPPGQHGGASP
jgi:hypothetical protein